MGANAFSEFRLIPRIETYPAAVAFAQTTLGRIIMLAAFSLGMGFFAPDLLFTLPLIFALALTTFMPENRHLILAIAPILLVVSHILRQPFRRQA